MPGEDSDLDLLVTVPQSDERPIARSARARRYLRRIPLAMDFIVKPRDEVARFAPVPASPEAAMLD
jgi:hypothetical protein